MPPRQMRIVFLIGFLAFCRPLAIPPFPAIDAAQAQSAKSPPGMISDFEARLTLARLLSNIGGRRDEAIKEYRTLLAERPEDPRPAMELSHLLMRMKRYPEAVRQLQTVLEGKSAHPEALTALARIYLWSGRNGEAAEVFDRLSDFGAQPPDVRLDMARAYTWNGEYDKAIEIYESLLIGLRAPRPEVYIELGNARLYNGQTSQAVACYRQALEIAPDSLEAQKQLALALSRSGQHEEALPLLTQLYRKETANRDVALALARAYDALDRRAEAEPLLRSLLGLYPEDAEMLADLADLEANAGHAAKCRALYLKAIAISGDNKSLLLRFARRMNAWGDFYKVEAIYRDRLAEHPSDFDAAADLAWLLVSAQRYEEAEGMYLKLLRQEPRSEKALLGLAGLKLLAKDFKASLGYAERMLTVNPHHPDGLFLKGEALYSAGKYSEALRAYKLLIQVEPTKARGALAAGKASLKKGDAKQAEELFATAVALAPRDIAARFWSAGQERAASNDFTAGLLEPDAHSSSALVEWARLYASQGSNRIAISCYEQALRQDPESFPAQMELAEILAVDHQYDRADEILERLAEEFPDASKILITKARVLGWARRYDQSIALYDRICKLNPSDPTPQKEKARTAAWGKKMDMAAEIYGDAYRIPVDRTLEEAAAPLVEEAREPQLTKLFRQLRQTSRRGSVYEGYERFFGELGNLSGSLAPETAAGLEAVRLDLLPSYKIQKAACLENRSKRLAWNRRFSRALDSYEELIEFQPGNEEARFDYAQVECSLGLCDREAEAYKDLLAVDPLHLFAGMGLERLRERNAPSVEVGQSYWDENGHGDLSRITRYRTDLRGDAPLSCRHRLGVAASYWLEAPKRSGTSYEAYGPTIEWSGVLSEPLSGAASWTHKEYAQDGASPTDAGFARLWLNLRDYARLGIGYDRSDEIYNRFGIEQDAQSDAYWIGASSYLTRNFELQGKARYVRYDDDNAGRLLSMGAGWAFTDHPRIIKLTLSGEYRDTDHDNIYVYRGSALVDIVHPYWAPQDYFAAAAVLEWNHDLSEYFFCGSELHYYDLRLGIGTDTDDNPSVRLEGEWRYEFKSHWAVGLKGLLHRSEDWDAAGAWATLKYAF